MKKPPANPSAFSKGGQITSQKLGAAGRKARAQAGAAARHIPVIYAGTPEDAELGRMIQDPAETTKCPRRYVEVGRWKSQHVNGGPMHGCQCMGMLITGTVNHSQVHLEILHGTEEWEPQTPNKMGKLGAFCVKPPSGEVIAEAVKRAKRAIARYPI